MYSACQEVTTLPVALFLDTPQLWGDLSLRPFYNILLPDLDSAERICLRLRSVCSITIYLVILLENHL